jgi:NCS1 family nucleobase:cation symporter-1
LISTAITLGIVIVGYQLILRFNRIMVWLAGLALLVTLFYTGLEAMNGTANVEAGGFTWAGFLGMASVVGV